LPGSHPVGDLVERAAPLGRMRLELGLGDRSRLGDRPRELLAQPDDARPLLLVDALEPLGVVLEPGLQRLDERAFALRAVLGALAEVALRAVEILVPRGEPVLDLALHLGEGLCQPVAQTFLALLESGAPRFRETALLLRVGGQRVGPRARERPFDLA